MSSRAPSGTAANPVRRNLFHSHHHIRRPTGAAAAPAGAAGATTNVSSSSSTTMPEVNRYDDSSDIIMRDHNGDPQFQMPQISLPMDDEQNGGGGGGNQEERERMSRSASPTLHALWEGGKAEADSAPSSTGLEERILETYKSRNLVPGDKMGAQPAQRSFPLREAT
ncbi:MAG: hypothetical protein LQ339_007882 [Xanthoria mediterranea]|nr:MAG: hypothetical protein LQ339_007882 [Xanthoria mediterranea]